MERRWHPGDAVALREVWAGRVFAARPATVVEDSPARTVFYVPGVTRALEPRTDQGERVRIPDRRWQLEDRETTHRPVLSFAFPDTPYAILATWDADSGEFTGWYINLQEPLRRTDLGFDTREHVLDALIPPDRSTWTWKDEDELDRAVVEGLFSPEEADRFRAAGERAIEQILLHEPPFDEDWEHWTPDPRWGAPELPASAGTAPVPA